MSPALPVVSGRKAIRALERFGFTRVSQKGSHVKMRNEDGRIIVIVPLHRELARGTLASILRQAGLSGDQFIKLL
ncbi:MAG: type II toxin-antitoxin system HicA family toxin [Actinomycetota bacterium]|nr:type II toxin-antitoxin system HicA family toxin [Actinomycetota bacterium]MDK1016862.1 type II toxin-antitoxin system HicA family toxin [Actinomycetota bacterium]MDK1026285.1 type II toxin-antitoxin system HicA family toxin [Actinomycetota bacterium]MDK1038929.1 type II toxin-antitoxin system HicA family toxin [Actinomycetota bacterium]MDK1097081.1 type II toxin-antitoxin system HicA family toxin [Actinomycetota bacterium]